MKRKKHSTRGSLATLNPMTADSTVQYFLSKGRVGRPQTPLLQQQLHLLAKTLQPSCMAHRECLNS